MTASSPRPRAQLLLLPALLVALAAAPVSAQVASEVTLDASPQLFTVLCALRAAGRTPDTLAVPEAVRAAVDVALARLSPERRAELEAFFEQRQALARDDVSAYVSTSLLLRPPPSLEFILPRDQLPADAWELREFPAALRTFYGAAGVDRLWRQVLPAYEAAIADRQADVAQVLLETRAYLRMTGQSTPGRIYVVYLEWLLPPALTNARSYGDEYYLVIHPQRPDLLDAVRHQYLHYLLDPVTLKYASTMSSWIPLQTVAQRARRLPAPFKQDLLLLATESLIQAVELRLKRLSTAEVSARLDASEQSGYILTRHFYYALELYEEAEPSIRFFFPELVRLLDVDQELARLERVRFSDLPASVSHTPSPDQTIRRLLSEGEALLAAGNSAAARDRFERVLQVFDPTEPRALYGLALLASQAGDREQAKQYFLRALERARAPHILGWTHVYLGRIYDLEGDRRRALEHYQAALALDARVEKMEQAARRGLQQPFGQDDGRPRF